MATSGIPTPSGPVTATSMLSNLPADFTAAFSAAADVPDTPDVTTDDAPAELEIDTPEVDDAPIDDAPPADDAPVDDAPVDDAPPAETEKAPATTEDELPDGVSRGKNRKGEEGYFLKENRYKNIYDNHKIVQQAQAALGGEPLTVEGIQLRDAAYQAQERMYSNLASGDPSAQGEVLSFILDEMRQAHTNGETGVDPTIPFAETVYSTLKEKAPDAYAHLRLSGAKDLLAELFDMGASSNDPHLFSSVQHVARAIAGIGAKPANLTDDQYLARIREATGRAGIPFHEMGDIETLARGEDPLDAANRRIAELEQQANGKTQSSSTEQFKTWDKSTRQAVTASVLDDAVKPALAEVEKAWSKFPNDYEDLVLNRLHSKVNRDLLGDEVLNQKAFELNQRARHATSSGVRDSIASQIKQLFINRAKLSIEANLPDVTRFAAQSLKGRSDVTHERRASAQERTAPRGSTAPVQASVVPEMPAFKNGVFDSATALKQADLLFKSIRR